MQKLIDVVKNFAVKKNVAVKSFHCITFVQITHQIQVLTEPLCRAQAIFYALPNNERGTKYCG